MIKPEIAPAKMYASSEMICLRSVFIATLYLGFQFQHQLTVYH